MNAILAASPVGPPDSVLDLVQRASTQSDTQLRLDERLSHAAMCVANELLHGQPLTAVLSRHCAAKEGVFDNLLLPLSVIDSDPEAFVRHAAVHLREEGKKRQVNAFGAALLERDGLKHIVLLVTERRGELYLDRVPKQPEDMVVFHGSLGLIYHHPRAVITTPFGDVREVPLQVIGKRDFIGQAVLPNQPGRYQLEIIARSTQKGPVVIANRAMFVGDAPRVMPRTTLQTPSAHLPPALQLLELMNEVRTASGYSPLVMDNTLVTLAQSHAEDMHRRGYFAHDSPETTPVMRLQQASIEFSRAAENIAEASSAEDAHETLMLSPGHRKNIVDPKLERVGIGVVTTQLSTGAPRVVVVIDFVQD